MKDMSTSDKILKILLREPFIDHTATSLAKTLGISRQGLWKSLNNMASENLISLKSVADTKKSAVKIILNFNNIVLEKTLSLLLIKESMKHERWKVNFKEIGEEADFVLLFGSILTNPKEANDIDILVVVKEKQNFKKIEEYLLKIQKTQAKKIHLIDLTWQEFKSELKINKTYLDALKKGVVLFGQDNFIKLMKEYGN